MKYYIDTEFLEGTQTKHILGMPYGKTKPTIDLISIGIVSGDGREYYAISKDFNLKEAWNRYDLKFHSGERRNRGDGTYKVYWIRENVLKPIFDELVNKWALEEYKANIISCTTGYNPPIKFTDRDFKKLINKYGKSNKQIAKEVLEFTHELNINKGKNPEFYGYYSDYDWVAFCWLFGKMIDLPNGFPMYCIDLKQILDEKAETLTSFELSKLAHGNDIRHNVYSTYDSGILTCTKTDLLKQALKYPKQANEHNALADAKWNKELHEFIVSLQNLNK